MAVRHEVRQTFLLGLSPNALGGQRFVLSTAALLLIALHGFIGRKTRPLAPLVRVLTPPHMGLRSKLLYPAVARIPVGQFSIVEMNVLLCARGEEMLILLQGQMCSEFVVIVGIGRKRPAQMNLAKDDDVIEAFPAD